jgi:hypothetical protein
MGHFVDLTMAMYGGESAMLEHVGEENTVSFRYKGVSTVQNVGACDREE